MTVRCGVTMVLAVVVGACAVGPDYQPPEPELAASFKSAGFSPPPAEGSWWDGFGDPQLGRLMDQAVRESPSARAALARLDQARAQLGLEAADAFPAVTAATTARRQQDSGNAPFSLGTFRDYRAALNLSWEIDLWGRVRRQIRAAVATAEAAAYDYRGAMLSLRGEVARTYLSLRFADAEIALLDETAALRAEARRLMRIRFEGGASSRVDHERAIAEHESVRAELEQLRARRTRLENALAALVGRQASGFTLAAGVVPRNPRPPAIVPSELLRRRPDLAAAERRLAAASERIGLAIASYLPRISLTGEFGVRSLSSTDLFEPQSKLWSLGPELGLPIFQGGRGVADRRAAEAAYREALALYRETLTGAVREVEDGLVDTRQLQRAAVSRRRSASSAQTAAQLVRDRYQSGASDYFEVVEAERLALNDRRAALAVELARALATTQLIQALGGGWQR